MCSWRSTTTASSSRTARSPRSPARTSCKRSITPKHPLASLTTSLLRRSAKPYYFTPAYNLVCYPNRDSSVFKEFYGLKDVQNLVRGTMRYGGFCEVVEAWKEIGLMSDANVEYLAKGAKPLKWAEFTSQLLGTAANEE